MDHLGEELSKKMMSYDVFYIKIPSFQIFGFEFSGITFPIQDTIITMWIIMAVLIFLSLWLTRNLKEVPDKKQSLVEVFVEFVNGICKENIGHHWRAFAPYIGTILLFLIFANIVSIFNIIPEWEALAKITHWEWLASLPHITLRPPAKDFNVTICMALMSIIVVLGGAIRYKKLSGWFSSLFKPVWFMFPFNVLEYAIKPMSLCMRLFGNILAAFIIMELIYFVGHEFAKYLLPAFMPGVVSLYFDIFDGVLQAFIFSFLTSLYIGEAVE